MPKKEIKILRFIPKRPSPTPEQLRNSRKAVSDFLIATHAVNENTVKKHPRIMKYDEKIRAAEKKHEEWEEKIEKRVEFATRGRRPTNSI